MAQPVVDLRAMSDEESDDDGPQAALPPPGQPRRERLERIALFDFLRLVAGNREAAVGHRTNEALVSMLKANETITSEALSRAMLACPRDLFVPPAHRAEALMDRPIRVDAAGFNISAPHVQAASLQALDIQPGERVLDVGCGCGIVTAYAAYLAGSSGEVVGIDVRDAAIRLSTSNMQQLRERNLEFSEVAAPTRIEKHNVFIPLRRHQGRYDVVHVGGAMPPSRLGAVLELLEPRGGRLVAPVGNDLLVVTKGADGHVRQRVLSQVSFSELEVPRDVEVVQAIEEERAETARRVEVPPSTFAADLAHLAAPGANLQAMAAAAAEAQGTAAAGGAAAVAPPAGAEPLTVAAGSTEAAGPSRPQQSPAAAQSPRRSPNGVRQRSYTSLEEAHLAPATLAPARRGSGGAGAGTAGPGGGGGGVAGTSPAPGAGPFWLGGWERLTAGLGAGGGRERPAESGPASMEISTADMEAGGGGRAAMDEEEGEEVEQGPRPAGSTGWVKVESAATATAAAPAGPIEMAGPPAPEKSGAAAPEQPPEPQKQLHLTDAGPINAGVGDITDGTDGAHNGDDDLPYLAGVTGRRGGLALGPPDCALEGPGFRLPAHKAVLQARCELLRAHMHSGMRDSDSATYRVPEAVERVEAVLAFLHYVYKDCLPAGGVDSEVMPQLLHAGIYYGCHRLVRLCESLLARELMAASSRAAAPGRTEAAAGNGAASAAAGAAGADGGGNTNEDADGGDEVLAAAVAAAGPLLAMADEGGLDQLRNVAMQFVLDHYTAVSATEGYKQLPRPLADAVTAEAVRRYTGLLSQLRQLAAQAGPPGLDDDD